jgi:hypothetical protein
MRESYPTNPKPEPIRIRHLLVIHDAKPFFEIMFLIIRQRIPEGLPCESKGEANGRTFDHALVSIAHEAPELGILWIWSMRETGSPARGTWVLVTAGKEGREGPKWSGEALNLGDCQLSP